MVPFFIAVLLATLQLAAPKLLIQSPMSLREKFKDGTIRASYANFGFIPYGHTMVSQVYKLIGLRSANFTLTKT